MALNQFVKKATAHPTPAPMETPKITDVSNLSEPIGLQYTKEAALGGLQKAEDGASKPSMQLSQSERETLSSLAAVQIRYNRSVEAVPYLMMLRKTDPTDMKSARLLALALIKLGNWEQAETILQEIHGRPETKHGVATGMLNFYQSLVAYRQKKFGAAREWLQRFRTFLAGVES